MADDPAFVWNAPPRPMPRPPARVRPTEQRLETEDSSPLVHTESDAVLVPLDEWKRILHQLGNLHEAGQQLAEAKERAGKAETEATFLRERLKDMRERVTEAEAKANVPPPEPEPLPAFGEWFVRRWLERRKRK